MGTVWLGLPLTVHDTLQWLTLLPILMQDHCGGDSVVLGTVPPLPPPPGISVPARDSSALYKSNNNSRKAQSLYGDRLALYKSNNWASPSMDTARRCTSPTTTAEKLSPSMETDWHCISLTIEPVPLWTQLGAVQVQQQQQKSSVPLWRQTGTV